MAFEPGRVRAFDLATGRGFIDAAGNHITFDSAVLARSKIGELHVGQQVRFELEPGRLRAAAIEIVP